MNDADYLKEIAQKARACLDECCAPDGAYVPQEPPPELKVPRGETSWLGAIMVALVITAVAVLAFAAWVAGLRS